MVNLEKQWIGVDFDATMFEYHDWVKWNQFGRVIPRMRDRVLSWVDQGKIVRVVSARVGLPTYVHADLGPMYSMNKLQTCKVTGELFSDEDMVRAMQEHMVANELPPLRVQCYKDYNMLELWDDRAVQVVPNTGRTLAEEHEAVLSAEKVKSWSR